MSSEQQPSSTPSMNPEAAPAPEPELSSSASTTSKPAQAPEPEPTFGWNAYAEKINGRLAMIGFVVLLIIEYFTHQDLITWLGLR